MIKVTKRHKRSVVDSYNSFTSAATVVTIQQVSGDHHGTHQHCHNVRELNTIDYLGEIFLKMQDKCLKYAELVE